MSTARLFPTFALALLLLSGCAASNYTADASERASIENVEDLVMHLGRQGYVLRSTHLVFPFALAEIGYEYRIRGERIRIYEFETPEDAERAVYDFLIDTRGGNQTSVYRYGSLMVAYTGRSPSLQLSLIHALGPAVY